MNFADIVRNSVVSLLILRVLADVVFFNCFFKQLVNQQKYIIHK